MRDAILDFDRAICLQPDLAEAYAARGNAKAVLGQYEEFLDDYEQAIQHKPDFAEAYYIRGGVRAALGNTEDARQDLEAALRLVENASNDKLKAAIEASIQQLDRAEEA